MKSNWTVEELDKPENADAGFIEAWNALLNSWRAELHPEEPPYPSSVDAEALLIVPEIVKLTVWAVWSAAKDKMLGTAILVIINTDENQDLASLDLTVHKDYRRQGIGSALLAAVLPRLRSLGRSRLTGETDERIPGGAKFVEVLGGRKVLESHINHLDLRELDGGLLEKWIQAGKAQEEDFTLGFWGNEYPEEDLEGVAHLYELANDQPMGAMAMERWKVTPDLIRDMNRERSQSSAEFWTYYLREKSSGKYVGYTEMAWRPEKDFLVQQGMTAVDPAYRGRGLGRWLKAVMLVKLLKERPQVRFVRTGNADNNAPMLRINQALGFKPYSSLSKWEVLLPGIEKYLETRVAEAN